MNIPIKNIDVIIYWGDTASDDIIEKSLEEKYNDLLNRPIALENK